MGKPCPDAGMLADFAAGAVPGTAREPVEEHLALCGVCRSAVAQLFQEQQEPEADRGGDLALSRAAFSCATAARKPVISISRSGWAAAAGILLAVGAGAVWLQGRAPRPPAGSGFPSGMPAPDRRIADLSGVLNRPEIVELPDGTVLRIAGETSARFLPSLAGERVRLFLERGELEARVPQGRGGVWIATPAGEIQVLGTDFTARVVRFPFESGVVAAAVVEVQEGAVRIANGRGDRTIRAHHRGILIGGESPIGQIQIGKSPPETLWGAIEGLSKSARPGQASSDLVTLLNLHRQAVGPLFDRVLSEKDARLRPTMARCVAALGTEHDLEELQTRLRETGEESFAEDVARWRRDAVSSAEGPEGGG